MLSIRINIASSEFKIELEEVVKELLHLVVVSHLEGFQSFENYTDSVIAISIEGDKRYRRNK